MANLENRIAYEEESSKNMHKDSLFSLISCVDALSSLHSRIQEKSIGEDWPITSKLSEKVLKFYLEIYFSNFKVNLSAKTADRLFRDVLSRKDQADSTRNALSMLTRFRFIFFLAESIEDNMAKVFFFLNR